ncbi:MAG: hypothetical protein FWG37_04200 [Clostridia bacterium]|nr:hypothetical protein [Clostridia bacterium]
MSETKKKAPPIARKVVSASTGDTVATKTAAVPPEKKSRAAGLRVAAAILWVLAIAAEIVAILMLTRYIFIPEDSLVTWLLVALGIDLVLVVVGSQLWKKANHIDPASKQNKLKFWLWNNLGVIISVIAFLPILILLLNDKKLDPKMKKLVSIVAAVALALGLATSYDWNPASQEDLAEAIELVGDGQVYWTRFGRKYHIHDDCSSLSNSSTLYQGSVEEAFEASRVELCKFCEARAEVERAVIEEPEDLADDGMGGAAADDPNIMDDAEIENAA